VCVGDWTEDSYKIVLGPPSYWLQFPPKLYISHQLKSASCPICILSVEKLQHHKEIIQITRDSNTMSYTSVRSEGIQQLKGCAETHYHVKAHQERAAAAERNVTA
jgi:hypothetical protein